MAAPSWQPANASPAKAPGRRKRSRRRPNYKPRVEPLENRLAPAVFTVNTFFDNVFIFDLTTGADAAGNISLRSALQAANATSASDSIVLAAGVYQLTQAGAGENGAVSGDLDVINGLDIQGAGSAETIIDANALDRAFDVFGGASLQLLGLTVANGLVLGEGGGIRNAGTVNLNDVVLRDNIAQGVDGVGASANPAPLGGAFNGFGGGIYNIGTLTVVNSTIAGNQALGGKGGDGEAGGGGGGGGMGAGGGIFNFGGNVTITNSTLSSNTAQGGVGGLAGPGWGGPGTSGGGAGGSGGDSGLPGNPGGVGQYGGGGGGAGSSATTGGNGGTGGIGGGGGGGASGLTVAGGAGGFNGFGGGIGGFAGNGSGGGGGGGLGAGGAIYNRSGNTSLTNVTISGNVAFGGAGGATWADGGGRGGNGGDGRGAGLFVDNGAVSVLNATIASNIAAGAAGGPVVGGSAAASPGSIGSGFGGGAANRLGTVNLKNVIIGDNTGGNAPDANGVFASQGNNLIESTIGVNLTGTLSGNILGVDPGLQPLAGNDGRTQTHAIDLNSPAFNAGNDTGAPTTDQRGFGRFNATDIGAFEFLPFVVTNTNDSGPGSLRQAILNSNASAGGNTITFQIGAAGSIQTIEPIASALEPGLPAITQSVTIDGWSQAGVAGYSGSPLIELNSTKNFDRLFGAFGLRVLASGVVIRGLAINGFNNINGEGVGIGVFGISGPSNVWIYGNYFGADPSGLNVRQNGQAGIQIGPGVNGVLIGTNSDGTNDTAEANLIAATTNGDGILIQGIANRVFGNFIGTPLPGASVADPKVFGNASAGIRISDNSNVIGGVIPGASNTISNSGRGAVVVVAGARNTIRGNVLTGNGFAIDLGDDFGTENDPGDPDTGPNNLQNSPAIVGSTYDAGTLTISFEVDSIAPASQFPLTIDFYLSDPSGNQLITYLGSTTYLTADMGTVKTVSFVPPIALSFSDRFVATATDSNGVGNTSELSAGVLVNAPPVLSLPGGGVSYGQGAPPVFIDASATLTDADGRTFNGGTLTVDISIGAGTVDQLGIFDNGSSSSGISVVGDTILFGGFAIGVFTGGTNGSTPLFIQFGESASVAAVQELVRNITFFTNSSTPGPRTVRFVLTDGSGGTSTATTQVSLTNAAPTNLGVTTSAANIDEGQSITLTGAFTDPDALDTHTLTIDWDDGTTPQVIQLGAGVTTFSVTHVFGDDSSPSSPLPLKTIRVSVTDGQSSAIETTAQVTVANVAPLLTAPPEPFISVNIPYLGGGFFIDPGDDTWTLTVDYGDGTGPTTLSFDVAQTFNLNAVYAEEGTYIVTLTVTDDEGATATSSFFANVFVTIPLIAARITAAPGDTESGAAGNVAAELSRSGLNNVAGSLVIAEFPPNAVLGDTAFLLGLIAEVQAAGLQTVGLFDVRSLNLNGADSVVVEFTVFSPDGLPPELFFIDPVTEVRTPVTGSTQVADSLTITALPGNVFLVRLVLDATSNPPLFFTPGTIFSITVPQVNPAPAPIPQTQFLVANLNGPQAVAQLDLSFARTGLTSGSQTTAATVASQSLQLESSLGGEELTGPVDAEYLEDILIETHRAFWRHLDRMDGPDGGGAPDAGGAEGAARPDDAAFAEGTLDYSPADPRIAETDALVMAPQPFPMDAMSILELGVPVDPQIAPPGVLAMGTGAVVAFMPSLAARPADRSSGPADERRRRRRKLAVELLT